MSARDVVLEVYGSLTIKWKSNRLVPELKLPFYRCHGCMAVAKLVYIGRKVKPISVPAVFK